VSSTCTVFAESEMVTQVAEGKSREDLVGALGAALLAVEDLESAARQPRWTYHMVRRSQLPRLAKKTTVSTFTSAMWRRMNPANWNEVVP
jgi:hypothetical protein